MGASEGRDAQCLRAPQIARELGVSIGAFDEVGEMLRGISQDAVEPRYIDAAHGRRVSSPVRQGPVEQRADLGSDQQLHEPTDHPWQQPHGAVVVVALDDVGDLEAGRVVEATQVERVDGSRLESHRSGRGAEPLEVGTSVVAPTGVVGRAQQPRPRSPLAA